MYSINGFGTRLYGQCDFAPDGSYTSTCWIIAAYLPLIPLYSLRITNENISLLSASYQAEKIPLHWPQVWRTWLYLIAIGIVFIGGVDALAHTGLTENKQYVVLILIMAALALIPAILRRQAKRRQGLSIPPMLTGKAPYLLILLIAMAAIFAYLLPHFQAA